MKTILLSLVITVCVGNCFAYYSSEQGRWLNRDPIGEDGGVNEYQFCGNNGVDHRDHLGLVAKVKNAKQIPQLSYAAPIFVEFMDVTNSVGGRFQIPSIDVVCSVGCSNDIYSITGCTVSWTGIISLNINYDGTYGGNAETIVGHEQKHYISWIARIERGIVTPLKKEDNTSTSSSTSAETFASNLADKYETYFSKNAPKVADQAGHDENGDPVPAKPNLPFPKNLGEFSYIKNIPK